MTAQGISTLTVEMATFDTSNTGGSDITSYNLQYNRGLGSDSDTGPVEADFVSLIG